MSVRNLCGLIAPLYHLGLVKLYFLIMTLFLSVSNYLGSFLFFLEQFLFFQILQICLALKESAKLSLCVLEVGLGLQSIGHNGSFVVDLGSKTLVADLTSIFLLIIGEDLDLDELCISRCLSIKYRTYLPFLTIL